MYDYTVNPINMGAVIKAQEIGNERRKEQQINSLTQRYLGGDASALSELAGVGGAPVAGQAMKVNQAMQPQQKDININELREEVTMARDLAKSGSPLFNGFMEMVYKRHQGTPMADGVMKFAQAYDQDPQAGIKMLDDAVEQFNQPREPQEPKTGRYVRERMGDKLAIIDSASGKIVREYEIPQGRKEKAELAKRTADIKKAETEAQLKVMTAENEEEKKQASAEMALEAAALADELAKDERLSQAVGTVSTMIPTVRASTQDVINKAQRLESLLTVDNLKLMSGVLTDKDISFLTRVASGLNITDNGIKGSEGAVRKRLSEIASKIRSVVKPSVSPESSEINWADL